MFAAPRVPRLVFPAKGTIESNTRADKTEIFGRVQSIERFHEMMRALYNELGRPLSEARCSEISMQLAPQKMTDQVMAYREAGYTVACWSFGFHAGHRRSSPTARQAKRIFRGSYFKAGRVRASPATRWNGRAARLRLCERLQTLLPGACLSVPARHAAVPQHGRTTDG